MNAHELTQRIAELERKVAELEAANATWRDRQGSKMSEDRIQFERDSDSSRYIAERALEVTEAARAVVRSWDAQKLGMIDPSVNTDLSSAIEYLRARAAYRSEK